MHLLLNRLNDNEWTTLVSLPRNDVKLAQAAIRGGAQGLKIHVNVHHHASGTHFGSWDEEKAEIARILKVAQDAPEGPISVGIVPGGTPFATIDEFTQMSAAGIDYFDAYPAEAPAWSLTQTHLDVMLAAFAGGDLLSMGLLESLGMTLCEASIVPHEEYGTPLSTLDLARYAALDISLEEAPFIVPSQKAIVPSDIPALQSTGAKGILIGAIVTGREEASIEAATRAFRDATPND
ncbi:MAG: hypothetical protein JWN98_2058 [Abditibacteriota bacterium]|nr:hypothetical protein [Abditibacteriota bacterium]